MGAAPSPGSSGSFAVGCLVALAPPYLLAGRPAVTVLFLRANEVAWDNLYQVFWRSVGYAGKDPAHLVTVATIVFLIVAAIVCKRLPPAFLRCRQSRPPWRSSWRGPLPGRFSAPGMTS